MSARGRTWRTRLAAVMLGTAIACASFYVFANIVLVNFAPIVHEFTFSVRVVDRDANLPIRGAVVSWRRVGGTLDQVGVTDETGSCQFTDLIQDNPRWLWPMIGSFRPRDRELHVAAAGFAPRVRSVADVVGGVAFSDARGELRIRLRRR